VISNQEIRDRLKTTGLCSKLTDLQLETILALEEGHEDDRQIGGGQEPLQTEPVPGYLNAVPIIYANADPFHNLNDWRSFKLETMDKACVPGGCWDQIVDRVVRFAMIRTYLWL
jgi:hypothetical protein